MGKNKYLESPEIMKQHFNDYVKWAKSNPYLVHDFVGKDGQEVFRRKERPLSIQKFQSYLAERDILTDVSDYFENKDGRYSEYVHIVTRIRTEIAADQIDGSMAGVFNPSVAARLNNLAETTNGKLEIKDVNVTYDR